jgi:DNA-binding transcriptional regulator GbsR (MarR family)
LLSFLSLTFINLQAEEIDKCEEAYNQCLEKCEEKQDSDACLEKCEEKFDKCSSESDEPSK